MHRLLILALLALSLAAPAAAAVYSVPANVTFNLVAGQSGSRQITITGDAGQPWSATTNTVSGGGWLSLSSSSGTVPATLSVNVDGTGLTAGAYSGSVTFTVPGATVPVQAVTVTVNVSAPPVSGAVITTVAGNAARDVVSSGPALSAALGTTTSAVADSAGNVFITDRSNAIVVKVTPAGALTVVAGQGSSLGDGGPAVNSQLDFPNALTFDSAGNLYIASNTRIRKVDTSGVITTVAGCGCYGFGGDGGLATDASMTTIYGVAVDAAGNIYIADSFNHRVRKVDTSGTINTIVGNGTAGYSGDNGPATAAQVNYPLGLALDSSGNLYIADYGNYRIRKVTTGGTISTVAGNGTYSFSGDGGAATSASLSQPYGVAVDAAGNLFIADTYNSRIRKVATGGIISTVAGSGTQGYSGDGAAATSAALYQPEYVSVDASGNLYIADQGNYRVRKVTSGGTISTIAGNGNYKFTGDGGAATVANLNWPIGVAADASGNLYIADQFNHRIRKVSTSRIITTVAGNGLATYAGDGGSATSGSLNTPLGVAVDASGNIYIADTVNHRVRKVTSGGTISTIAGNGTAGFSGDGAAATSASLNNPRSVAVDAAGNIYIADAFNNRIRKVVPAGTISTIAGTGFATYSGDNGPATAAALANPSGLALDAGGNLFIADISNNRVRKITPGGTITTVAGDGTTGYGGEGVTATATPVYGPQGVAVDSSGNLYIAEINNHRVRKVTTGGIISTVAGTGAADYGGDGGLAALAQLHQPQGVAVDSAGTIYIADSLNDRIRAVYATASTLNVTPISLDFTAAPGATLIPSQTIGITSTGASQPWTASVGTFSGGNWLGISATAGTTPASPTITVNASTLSLGTYYGTITVQSGSIFQVVNVTFTVASLSYSVPPTVTFNLIAGQFGSVQIPISGSPVLSWSAVPATSSGTWLGLSSTSGTIPGAVTATAFTATLSPGVYSGTVTFTVPQVATPTQVVAVTLTVLPLPTTGPVITTVAGSVAHVANGVAVNTALGYLETLAVDSGGNVYAADSENSLVVKVTPAGALTVVAGGGTSFPGDGGPAVSASLSFPAAVAVDALGDLYIADSNRIRRVDPSGTITTIAGTGLFGFSGDNGPATNATLAGPRGIAIDSAGNIYIADSYNQRIRKVNLAGIITTVAGSGVQGHVDGPALSAQLDLPYGLALDSSGNLYMSDAFYVRKLSGGIITTVAGNGSGGLSGDGGLVINAGVDPWAEAVDAAGNLYIADASNNVIRKVDLTGIITTVGGTGSTGFSGDGGPATLATLNFVQGVGFDPAGNMFIADWGNRRVRKVIPSGTISTVAGNGGVFFGGDGGAATLANMDYASRITVDSAGNFYVADENNHRIRKVTPAGVISTVAGNGVSAYTGDGGPATSASLSYPRGVAVDSAGNLFIADSNNNVIRKVSTGGTITTYAGNGQVGYLGDGGPATSAEMDTPESVTVDNAGNVFIADYYNNVVRKVTPGGTISTVAGNHLFYSFSGDGGPAVGAGVDPYDVAVDSAGNLYIADLSNHRIRKVTTGGIISTFAGTGLYGFGGDGGTAVSSALAYPKGVAVDASGNLYVVDTDNLRIRKVTGGVISTIAGDGNCCYGGDGGLATRAQLNFPHSLGSDSAGNVFIADSSNNVVRKVSAGSTPLFVSTTNLQFTVILGTASVPSQNVSITSSPSGASWTTSVATTSGGNWLSLTSASGVTPASTGVQVNIASLGVGTYQGTVTVKNLPAFQIVNVALTVEGYLVGDVNPSTGNALGQYGDSSINNFDLIDALRAVTLIPGARPPACSDRFDAMDSYPTDTLTTRGGDGSLDNFDLIATLRRVTLLDTTLPRRTSKATCGASPLGAFSPARRESADGELELGTARAGRVPVYLVARKDLDLAGFSFSMGAVGNGRLDFPPGDAGAPSLIDNGVAGTLAMAWLDGMTLASGERKLLGYVHVAGSESGLRVYGTIANHRNGAAVPLSLFRSAQ